LSPAVPLDFLLQEIRQCRACEGHLPLGPRPVVQAGKAARILIVGQAPGKAVHESGVPWNDASGNTLRRWMGINAETFYDSDKIAIIPMGYCYPGRGKSGDLPPRRECAELWLDKLLEHLAEVRLTLLVGQYAQKHFLGPEREATLTETVQSWQAYAPDFFPLPHPSPRNTPWLRRHAWFEESLLPELRRPVALALEG
jgi:uracil-DNA glycosylase